MQKILIHTEKINVKGTKLQLQIKLPRNTKSICAITATSTGMGTPSLKKEVGWLWLRIPEHRDVFFADIIHSPVQQYDFEFPEGKRTPSIGYGEAWLDSTIQTSFSVDVPGEITILEGYYTDQLKDRFINPYSISIYLTLEV